MTAHVSGVSRDAAAFFAVARGIVRDLLDLRDQVEVLARVDVEDGLAAGARRSVPTAPRVEDPLDLALNLLVLDPLAVDDPVGAVLTQGLVAAEALHQLDLGAEHVAQPVADGQQAPHVPLAEGLVEHLEGLVDQRLAVALAQAHAERADEHREAHPAPLHLVE